MSHKIFVLVLQPFIALCRCEDPKAPKRPIFNWIHWFFGTIGSVLAGNTWIVTDHVIVTLFLNLAVNKILI